MQSPNKVRGLPLSLPRVTPNESSVDASLLDVMGLDEYLSLLKNKTENKPAELWKETSQLAMQLKASRELLAIGSSLYSNSASRKILDRLIESIHVILNAERVYLLEIDPSGTELVVTYSKDQEAVGLRISLNIGIEGMKINSQLLTAAALIFYCTP